MVSSPFARGHSVRAQFSVRLARLLPSVLLTLTVVACDDAATRPSYDETPAKIQLSAATLDLDRGDTTRINAVVLNRSGSPIASPSAGQPRHHAPVKWTSSDPSIANISRSGLILAHRSGQVTLQASAGSLTSSASLSVDSKGKSVTISPKVDTLHAVGHTLKLSVTVLNGAGKEHSNPSVNWSSLDHNVASVDGDGIVTALAAGAALVVATAQGQADTAQVVVLSTSSDPLPVVALVEVTPDAESTDVGGSKEFKAKVKDGSGQEMTDVTVVWSSSDPEVATVSSNGVVTAQAPGSAKIRATAEDKSGSAVLTVLGDSAPPPGDEDPTPPPTEPEPIEGGVVVSGFTTKAVQDALGKVVSAGGGVLRFPAGTYDLRDWPSGGVRVDVPITLVGEGSAVLRGSGSAHLFDFGKQVHVENLEFRNWLRPIRFARVGEWNNYENAEYVRVVGSRFYDVAIAVDGRKESGTPPSNPHKMKLVHVSNSRFERTRRVVDFRRIFVDRFEFTHNQVREVVHRSPEPDVPGAITSVLYIGADPADNYGQRATEVYVAHNDIRHVRNEDASTGRAYALLMYRGPTIVEHNHIEDVVSSGGQGSMTIYQRSWTYARFAHNTVVNGTSASNSAALFAKNAGRAWDVIGNTITFTKAFKDQHGSPEYHAFGATGVAGVFEDNTVVGATRGYMTLMDTNAYGRAKSEQIVRNNTFQDCAPQPNSSGGRYISLGYRRTLVEVSGNRFVNCSRGGGEFMFISGADNFQETDELRITENEWIHTVSGLVVPPQVIRFNAYPRRALITDNRYEYRPSDPSGDPTPITFVMLPSSLEGEAGARVTVVDNRLVGFRNGTAASISVLDSRAALQELVVERNRATSGGHFVRISRSAPERTVVRNNDVTGIRGELVRKEVEGGELVVSGNTQ